MTRPKNLPPGRREYLCSRCFQTHKKPVGPPCPLLVMGGQVRRYNFFPCWPQVSGALELYEVISEAFRHPDLQSRPHSQMLTEMSGVGQLGLILGVGDSWKEHRKFTFSVFRSLGVGKKSYEDTIAAEMAQLGGAIEEKKGTAFNPNVLFEQAVANVICSIVFGTQYQYSDTDFQHVWSLLWPINPVMCSTQTFVILIRNLVLAIAFQRQGVASLPNARTPFGFVKQFVNTVDRLLAFSQAQLDSHMKDLDPDHPKDLIDQYLIKLEETQGAASYFDQLNLKYLISDLFIAGTETTTTTLKWCFIYMMAFPEVQSRVQAELDQVVGRERMPGWQDRKNLPYTCAVLMEVQRKGAVGAMGVPHVAAADVTIKGYTIPKDTIIFSNIWNVLNNELLDDSDAFTPERFLSEDGTLVKRDDLIIFSTGRRVCIGEQIARMETFLGFTSLLHRFTFKKPDNSPPLSSMGS
ncbi:LOW QUALITY PROTEIN: cytochrome P450 2J6 [Strongylocentrotus purpuratus]|uniref:Cytochrome P450 n=1 Tax=Strongylocentrotus purpuratus TaxID=7668 RepID=A0A7M7NI36_STRPU|nr:LOW QUALITY PROTEIN: cytochrome P450 2J6 [Strongylocentrotus purpuratus]